METVQNARYTKRVMNELPFPDSLKFTRFPVGLKAKHFHQFMSAKGCGKADTLDDNKGKNKSIRCKWC